MAEIIKQELLREVVKENKMNYSFNTNLFRAFPNVNDGLKVVHRRIIYSMNLLGLFNNKKYVKSAKVVGDCLAKFHAHGDASVYNALVLLVQDFYMNVPLAEGSGNFGSISGDSAAAQRYTEVKLSKYGGELLDDINSNSVNWTPNYLGDMLEPVTLPVKYPNLLINGSYGIGQAYLSSIPPHNINEIIDMTIKLINDPEIELEEIAKSIRPDYPNGGVIINNDELTKAYMTGYGNVKVRAKIEHDENKSQLIITEIPYMSTLGKIKDEILSKVKGEQITGISDVTDATNGKNGVRLIITVKKGYSLAKVESQLYKETSLQDTLILSLIATRDDEEFKMFNIKEMFESWIEYRKTTLKRIWNFEMSKIRKRKHIIEGLLKAINDIDTIIKTIKQSNGKKDSIDKLLALKKFKFTELQARHIAEMELYKISALTSNTTLKSEDEQLSEKLDYYFDLYTNEESLNNYIIKELEEGKKRFGKERKTLCTSVDTSDEVFVEDKEYMIMITNKNMFKKVDVVLSAQNRGGKGRSTGKLKDKDYILYSDIAHSNDNILFFSNKGRVYSSKVHQLESCKINSLGLNIKPILNLDDDEKIITALCLKNEDFNPENSLVFITKKGLVKRTSIDHYDSIRKSGIIALKLNSDDSLVKVVLNKNENEDLILTSHNAKVARFEVWDINLTYRDTLGVKGIDLQDDDYIIGADVVRDDTHFITVVTEQGKGKKVMLEEITKTQRSVKGMMICKLRKGDYLATTCLVNVDNFVTIITNKKMIKLSAEKINSLLRPAIGVNLVDLDEDDIVIDSIVE